MRLRAGLRHRLVLSLIALVVATVLLVGAGSVFLVERSLRDRMVEEALTLAEFNLTVLVPATGLQSVLDADAVEEAGLIDRFLRRGTDGAWVEFPDGNRISGGTTPSDVSAELRGIVARGEIGYQFVDAPEGRILVTAARLPPGGPDFFFATSARPVDDTVRQVVAVVSIAGAMAVVAGVLVASGIAGRMLRPVSAAREAAEEMAAGDLEVHLAEEGSDEFSGLSRSFNRMAASLQHTIQQLAAAQARERRFVADVSHELRTPLTGLVNEAQMLLRRLRTKAEVTDDTVTLASMLESDVGRLRHLVEDLLEISRLDSDGDRTSPIETDVTAFLSALIAQRHPAAVLHSDLTAPVMVDARALERVIGNLVDNARIHAPGAEVRVDAGLRDGHLVIEVADRGRGVAPDALERIFERFSTADPSRSGGAGLGLAIVARHVDRMGGEVTAVAPEAGGLVIGVRIPVAELLHDGESSEISISQSGE